MIVNHCGSCGFYRPLQQNSEIKYCILDQVQRDSDYYCGRHTNQPEACDMCKRIIINKKGIITLNKEGKYMLICEDCCNSLGTCSTCIHGYCGLQSDTSGRPKMVQRQMQNGGMIISTQVLNPDLVQEYCTKCSCYYNNQCQCKTGGTCGRYESVIS